MEEKPVESGLSALDEEPVPSTENDGEGDAGEIPSDALSGIDELTEELDKIHVEIPKINTPSVINMNRFPMSYKENVAKERLILQYAENFRRQFVHLYRDRKPLLLNPVNECNVEKFVSTTIQPTLLPFQEMYNYDGCAEFVADYVTFEPLDSPIELPRSLRSPTTILETQKGTCFEMSSLLCSFLLGAGYDAYVVCGYANRETTLCDEIREICPLLKKKDEVKEEEKQKEVKKYTVKPPKDLQSKFIRKQEMRKNKEIENELEKKRLEEVQKQEELEKAPTDELHGLRIHSWVLVLLGKREVPENFFIEPFTGNCYLTQDERFHGIESIWNNTNYWVNMQDCSNGCKDMIFDLGDCVRWEYMFPGSEKPTLEIVDEDELEGFEDEEDEEKEEEKHLDMPPSWVSAIKLTLKQFQTRCPMGKKTTLYKRSKLEKFARYLIDDGLITKLSMYKDQEMKDLTEAREWYAHRADQLDMRCHNHKTGQITEYYKQGRQRHLKEHIYKAATPGPETERTMMFYHQSRVDGLVKREETSMEMTEHFTDRRDFLYYRNVQFGKRPRKLEPANSAPSHNPRPILKITNRFHRNPKKPANEDIAELVFQIKDDRIQLTFHHQDSNIIASTREFVKPPNANDKGSILVFSPELTQTFQVNPHQKNAKNLEVYNMLVDMVNLEDKTVLAVRESEEEVREILENRLIEEARSELTISVYDTERNEKAKRHRLDREKLLLEEKKRREEMELDYLAPFLAQRGDPVRLTKDQAYEMQIDCLGDLKQRLIDKANIIQERFELETGDLQKKQKWYQENQVNMLKEDEEEYLEYCSEAMFRIHILELRLNRHKEMAQHKYNALEQRLRTDPRLAEFF